MRRGGQPRGRLVLAGLLLGMGLSLAQSTTSPSGPAVRASEDLLPVRRVVLRPEQLLSELKRVHQGTLVRLPRADFEKKWQKAQQQTRLQARPPRLLEARYRASLVDEQSLVGSATWKLAHAHASPAIFPLGNTSLALRSCRYENRPAALGDFAGNGTLGLLVDEAGENSLILEWSARVDARPEGLQLELNWPESPVAVLELDLPAGKIPVAPDGLLVAGPQPAELPERRLWTIACGGRASLPLLIRDTTRHRKTSLLVQQRSVQRLAPSGVEATHTLTLEALHRPLESLTLQLDPRLRLLELRAPDLQRWERLGDGRVHIHWARPMSQQTLEVRALAALPLTEPNTRWESPAIQVEGAIARGETLELWVHTDLELTGWGAGDFRLVETNEIAENGTFRVLRLQGGGIAANQEAFRRPRLQLRASGARFRTLTQHFWRLDPEASELTAEIRSILEQGELDRLPLLLPPGWAVESVETQPADLQRGWSIRAGKPTPTLNIDLRRTVRAPEVPVVVVRLRPSGQQLPLNVPLTLPEIVPLEARYREAGLAIDYDRQTFRATLQHETGEAAELPAEGPWSRHLPEQYLFFRGEPIVGTLRLQPRQPLTRARLAAQIRLLHSQPLLEARLSLLAETGRPNSMELELPEAGAGPWEWRLESGDNRLLRTERRVDREITRGLAALAARSPVELAVSCSLAPRGALVQLRFDRPLTPRRPVVLTTQRKVPQEGTRWKVPLAIALGTTRFEGEVQLLPVGLEVAQSLGLTELARDSRRVFRYGARGGVLELQPRPALSRSADALIDSALLTSQLQPDGTLRHTLRFRLQRWMQRTLPLQLPPEVRLLSAKLDEYWIDLPHEQAAELPVPASGQAYYTLSYQTQAQRGWVSRLHAPLPHFPVPVVQLRRVWFLPRGMRPLGEEARALPGALPAGVPLRYPLDVLRGGPLPRRLVGGLMETPAAESSQPSSLLREAQTAWLARPPELLGERIRWLQLELLQESQPLVIDTEALRSVGLTALTPLQVESDPLGEAGQLELLAVPEGLLLTRSGRYVDRNAFHQAVLTGQDETGGYQSGLLWLEVAGDPLVAPLGYVAWIPALGTEATLYVVELPHMMAWGLLLALTLIGLMVWLRRYRLGTRLRWLVGWLALAGVSLAWLPAGLLDLARWSVLAGLLVGLPLALLSPPPPRRRAPSTFVPQPTRPSPAPSHLNTLSLLLLVLGLLAWPSQAQAPAEDVVYLLDAVEGDVLVPPALLKRIDTLAANDAMPRSYGVLTQASYTGKQLGDSAEFTAEFEALTFTEQAVPLVLPLENVQLLGEVLLDGAKVLPRTLPPPRSGYEITLRGKGTHKIQLRFRVPITALGEEEVGQRQLRWGIPRLAQSRLIFEGSPNASYLSCMSKQGSQSVTTKDRQPRLEVDLGPISTPVTLRWVEEASRDRATRVECREAYWWELRPEGGQLNASLRYTIQAGTLSRLQVEIPPELEVVSAQARRPRRSSELPLRLKDWYLAGPAGSQLQLEFPLPFSGAVEVDLVLLPRRPLAEAARLALPQPQGVVRSTELGYLAYRLTGLEAERTGTQGLTGLNPSRFAEDWPALARPTVERLSAAFTFRRTSAAAPELRLRLWPRPDPFRVVQEIHYRLGPRRVEWSCRAELFPQGSLPGVVEWDLGPDRSLLVSEISGSAVSRWQQNENRLLIWLNAAEPPARLTLQGFVPLRPEGKIEAKKPLRVSLPPVRALAASVQTTLRWENQEVQATLLQGTGLKNLAEGRFLAANGLFTVQMQLQPIAPAPVRVVTQLRGKGRELQFETHVEYPERVPAELGASLRNWPGTATLEVAPGQARELRTFQRQQAEEREQTWRMQAVSPRGLRYRIVGTAPFSEASLPVPELHLFPAAKESIYVVEPSLQVETPPGWTAIPAPPEAPPGSLAFRVSRHPSSNARVQLRTDAASYLRPLWTEAVVRRTSQTHWLHEVTWWLQPHEAVELTVRLPRQGHWLDLRLDDEPLSLNVEQPAVVLALTPSGQVRRLRARYRLETANASISEPTLALPRLEGWQTGPTLWTVTIPVGWQLQSASVAPLSFYQGIARRDLARAAALRSDPAAAPQLAALLASAEAALRLQPDPTLSAQLQALRDELGPLPTAMSLGSQRSDGCLVRWYGTEPPSVRLRSRWGMWPEHALGATLQWAVLWLLVWLSSHSPWLRHLAQWIWPEILVGLALLAWSWLGPTLAILVLLLAGVTFRLLLVGRGVSRWWTPKAGASTI